MSIYKPKDRKEAKRSILIMIVVLAAVCVVVGLALGALTGGGGDSTDQVRVVVTYSGSWSGAYGDLGGIQSWSHTGSYSVILDRTGSSWVVSANAQKSDDSTALLIISIQDMDGHVLKTASTTAAYGVAQVALVIE